MRWLLIEKLFILWILINGEIVGTCVRARLWSKEQCPFMGNVDVVRSAAKRNENVILKSTNFRRRLKLGETFARVGQFESSSTQFIEILI